jgi:DNA-3-methyladenine glycosylase II
VRPICPPKASQEEMHEFRLTPPAPFNFEGTASFLSPGAAELVDVFDGKRFTRLLDVGGRMRLALVSSLGTSQRPDLIVTLMNGTERDEPGVVALVSRMLGLGYDLHPFFRTCREDQALYGLSSDFYGLKPPQRMHPFEALVLSIASKPGLHFFRTSVSALSQEISYKVAYAGDTFYAFPSPRILAKHAPEEMAQGTITAEQAARLQGVARAVMNGTLDIVGLARAPLAVLVERLAQQDGVGLVGAQLTALIGYGRLDCFPTADPLLRQWMGVHYGTGAPVEIFEAERLAEAWGAHRGVVAFLAYAELMRDRRL